MADMTTTEALAQVPASTTKTAILAAADAYLSALDDAETAGAIGETALIQIKSEFVDHLETVGVNVGAET